MRWTRVPLAASLLAALMLPAPAAAPVPAAHEEVGGTLDELLAHLQELRARWREHFGAREPRGERPLITLMLRHREELGLSPEQVRTLERLRADFQREAIRREADLRIVEVELQTLLEADPADMAQVEGKVREIERLRADLRLARIRVIEQGKAELSPEQRQKLRSLLAHPPRPRHWSSRGVVLPPAPSY
jgi:Spy/CpxP family protein refolding chaperone